MKKTQLLLLCMLILACARVFAQPIPNDFIWTGHVQFDATGNMKINRGGDATGDIYYRQANGTINRLGIGTPGQILTVNAGLPKWLDPGGGGSGTVTTVIQGYGVLISPNPLVSVGTIRWDSAGAHVAFPNWRDTLNILATKSDLNPIVVTVSQMRALEAAKTVKTGRLYNITNADISLYGGSSIFVLGTSDTTISLEGQGLFYNPRYVNATVGYGIWNPYGRFVASSISGKFTASENITANNGATGTLLVSVGTGNTYFLPIAGNWAAATSITGNTSTRTANIASVVVPSYAIGNTAIWGGKLWTNTTGSVGTSTDIYTLDANWTPVAFNRTSYNIVSNDIEYDLNDDKIIARKDRSDNEVRMSYWSNYDNSTSTNPIKSFQWGNDLDTNSYKGIGVNHIIDSYFECINFTGSTIRQVSLYQGCSSAGNIFLNTTYMQQVTMTNNCTFSGNVNTSNSGFFQITLNNGSSVTNNKIGGNSSRIQNVNLNNGSSISQNVLNTASTFLYFNLDKLTTVNNNNLNNTSFIRNIDASVAAISLNVLNNTTNINHIYADNGNVTSNVLDNSSTIDYVHITTGSLVTGNQLDASSTINYVTMANVSRIFQDTLNTGTVFRYGTMDRAANLQNATYSGRNLISFNLHGADDINRVFKGLSGLNLVMDNCVDIGNSKPLIVNNTVGKEVQILNKGATGVETISNSILTQCVVDFAGFTGCTLDSINAQGRTFTFTSNNQVIKNESWLNNKRLDSLIAGTGISISRGSNGIYTINASGAGTVTGSGVANQLTYWTGASSIGGEGALTYNPATNQFLWLNTTGGSRVSFDEHLIHFGSSTTGGVFQVSDDASTGSHYYFNKGDFYINNVPVNFPAANAVGVFTNDGSGNCSWAPAASAAVNTENVVYVTKNGNDATGIRNDLSHPFLTEIAAVSAAANGDAIVTYPGIYQEAASISLDKNNNFTFIGHGTLTSPTGFGVTTFTENGVQCKNTIFAPNWTFNGTQTIFDLEDSSYVTMNVDTIISSNHEAIIIGNGTKIPKLNITANYISSAGASNSTIQENSGNVILNVGTVNATGIGGTEGITVEKGSITVIADKIMSNARGTAFKENNTDSADVIFVQANLVLNDSSANWTFYCEGNSHYVYLRAQKVEGWGSCNVVAAGKIKMVAQVDEIHNRRKGGTNNRPRGLYNAEQNTNGDYSLTAIGTKLITDTTGGTVLYGNNEGKLILIGVETDGTRINMASNSQLFRVDKYFPTGILAKSYAVDSCYLWIRDSVFVPGVQSSNNADDSVLVKNNSNGKVGMVSKSSLGGGGTTIPLNEVFLGTGSPGATSSANHRYDPTTGEFMSIDAFGNGIYISDPSTGTCFGNSLTTLQSSSAISFIWVDGFTGQVTFSSAAGTNSYVGLDFAIATLRSNDALIKGSTGGGTSGGQGIVDIEADSLLRITLPVIRMGIADSIRIICPVIRVPLSSSNNVDDSVVVVKASDGRLGKVSKSSLGLGTVTSFSSGNLAPLFTTSVGTPTTTPAQTFTLTNAGANTYFGNATIGSAAPSYISAGALTKVDDTNVTMTLGGNAATSLLRATSMTLGWTGQLGYSRGGTGASSFTNHGVVVAGASSLSTVAPATSGNVLTSDGTDWQSSTPPAAFSLPILTNVNNQVITDANSNPTLQTDATSGGNLQILGYDGSNANIGQYGFNTEGEPLISTVTNSITLVEDVAHAHPHILLSSASADVNLNAFTGEVEINAASLKVNSSGEISKYANSTINAGDLLIGDNSNQKYAVGAIGSSDGTIIVTPSDGHIDLQFPAVIERGNFSQVGTATTTFTVSLPQPLTTTVYSAVVTPTAALSAALFYVTNKTTTTFDVVYLAGLTGTVTFNWVVVE